MMQATKIAWTDATWNPVTGCTKVSAGCAHCYAERMAKRLRGRGGYPTDDPFRVTLHKNKLNEPLRWRKPRMVFVCSMGDLFHPSVPDEFIYEALSIMVLCQQHYFQILTKRPERMAAITQRIAEAKHHDAIHQAVFDAAMAVWLKPEDVWPRPNIWLGTSIEDQAAMGRADHLRRCPAALRFLSLEPLLEPLPNLNLDGISWTIVGGESGPGARPMNLAWPRSIRDQCKAAGVLFFMKQLSEGGRPSTQWQRGRYKNINAFPEDLRIREMPVTRGF